MEASWARFGGRRELQVGIPNRKEIENNMKKQMWDILTTHFFGLIWFGLVSIWFVTVWFGLVWFLILADQFGLVWFGFGF